LFDYGFNQFMKAEILPADHAFKGNEALPVNKGEEKEVKIGLTEPVTMLVKSADQDKYTAEFVADDSKMKAGEVEAPVKEGTSVGKANIVHADGQPVYGNVDGTPASFDVVTKEAVEKAGWFSLTLQAIGDFFAGIWDKSTGWVKGLF